MKDGKSILYTALVFLFVITFSWFASALPPQKFKKLINDLPKYADSSIVKVYPDDLVISIKNGQVNINQESPYCFSLADNANVLYDVNAIADPSAFSISGKYSDFCRPMVLVGQSFIMYPDGSKTGQYKINSISTNIKYDVTKDTVTSFVEKTLPKVIKFGKTAYIFAPLLMFLALYPFILVVNFWYSTISKLVLKVFKIDPKITNGKIYGTSLLIYGLILLNNLFIPKLRISFPFANTLFTSIGSLVYFKYLINNQPIEIDKNPTPDKK